MIRKLLLLFGLMLSLHTVRAQQQIILLTEDFETGSTQFVSDTTGPGTQTGNNKWVVNKVYNGQSTYPNTTSQDSVYFNNGTIFGAPQSNYLHIYNSASSPSVANANFDPTASSDRFSYTQDGFCTLGMNPIKLVFFYTIEGDTTNPSPTAYGQVYYSINNGPWVQTGQPLYSHQTKWRYEQISDPAFSDKPNVRFGFRWVNTAGSIPKTISFGVDGIQVIGTYDSILNPLTITIDSIEKNPACQGSLQTIDYSLSKALCDGSYVIELSDVGGDFAAPSNPGSFSLSYPFSNGRISFIIPTTQPAGTCYRVRIIRLSPAPGIVSAVSNCFTIQACSNTITTMNAVVLTDPDTACVQSAIDIKFKSTGVYQNNNYIAQLSDSAGNFTNPYIINTKPDNTTYDPLLGVPPGQVSGLIPVVPPGCNYYVRIVSTNGVAIGTAIGPFCIKHCDMETNKTLDIQACINEVTGYDTTLSIDINKFDSTAHYYKGNYFRLQVLSTTTLAIINTGGLFAVYDSVSNVYHLHIPKLADLQALGIAPGSYYARLIADSSSNSDTLSTIIHLTIGAPSINKPVIVSSSSLACSSGGGVGNVGGPIQTYTVTPANLNSNYYWFAPFLPQGGTPFTVPDNYILRINFSNASPNYYVASVREENYGCYGEFSDPDTITIISPPIGKISGPLKVCLGDTVSLSVPFLQATYYSWSLAWGSTLYAANNEVSAVFDSVGTAYVYSSALNGCGSGKDTFDLKVISLLSVAVAQDTAVCKGEPVTLSATTGGINKTLTTGFNNNGAYQGVMFNVSAREPLTINSFDGNFTSGGAIQVEVYYKTGSYVGFQNSAFVWTLLGTANITAPAPLGSPTTIPIPVNMALAAGDTVAFYITNKGTGRTRYINGLAGTPLAASDSVLDIYQGRLVTYPFGSGLANKIWSGNINYTTVAGLRYQWTNGDSLPSTIVRPDSTMQYSIRVSDTSGCGNVGKAIVTVKPTPRAEAGDSISICYGTKVHVMATAAGSFHWYPTTGLPDSTALDFYITPDTSITYELVVTDSLLSCKGSDQLKINVVSPEAEKDSGILCANKPATLKLPNVVNGHYLWNTGDTTQQITVIKAGTYTGNYYQPGDSCAARVTFTVQQKESCDELLQVPQAFTPNNDGVNDHFTIFGQNIVDYEIKIFNRWGELVYESTDASEINDLTRGWDGTYKGKLQNLGTFVYYVNAKDSYNNTASQHGNLTLIR